MNTVHSAGLTVLFTLSCVASAQDNATPPPSKEQKETMAAFERMSAVRPEHKQLGYFVGDWKATTTMWMDPKAPQTSEGKSHAEATLGVATSR